MPPTRSDSIPRSADRDETRQETRSEAWALAIDFGGTKVEAALVDSSGNILPSSRTRATTGPTATSLELSSNVRRVATEAVAYLPERETLLGVGIGSAGPVSLEHGLVSPLNLPVWRDFPLRDLVAETVPETVAEIAADVPVVLRMDGSCLALAEHWVGVARGVPNMMGIVVSTGIGGGIILRNRIVEGRTGNAGHIGHVEVGGFDDPCACGGTGCVEAIASGPKTVAWARSRGFIGNTGEDLATAYAAGDAVAIAAVARSARAIGQALASAAALLDLELVVVSGGFSRVTPDLVEQIRGEIASRTEFNFITSLRIVASTLTDSGPLVGAAALIHRSHLVVDEASVGDDRTAEHRAVGGRE
jgi:glucokinase